ncbi:hypothetical protein GCM10014715_14550 [Streptomyces spiralis]|uniref:Uncharacterized protein n=1 Tax=Streptomyces spiralis TaxID=66376 RepID=A0A918ZNS4_9ACTN|nr:hypothetical protein [Streptomyces spiralis]GHE62066.1 hypothetical protein GCM10014715_14550 [Streptomyces spiralis]
MIDETPPRLVAAAERGLWVAAAHFGREPVTRLLPHPDRPTLLAAVRPAGPSHSPAVPGLYDAVWRRHSNRFPRDRGRVFLVGGAVGGGGRSGSYTRRRAGRHHTVREERADDDRGGPTRRRDRHRAPASRAVQTLG